MRQVGKRFLCIVLSFAILNFGLQNYEVELYAAEKRAIETSKDVECPQTEEASNEPVVDKKDAKKIAEFQVDETVKREETDWKPGTKVRKVYNLYDDQKEICANAVELKHGNKDAGYVVVGAGEEYSPIIEFKTSGRFLDESLQSGEYLLYDGNIDYYKVNQDTDQATNIESEKQSFSMDKLARKEKKSKNITKEKSSEWKAIKERVSFESSNPPTRGDVNTNPGNYESGYNSITRATVPDAVCYKFFEMEEFGPGGICTPTAACNLLKYYMDRKRMKSSLLINNSWNLTFNRLKSYFKTGVGKEGTYVDDVKPGLDRYFRDINIQDAVTRHYDYAEWAEMKRRIDFGEPFLYSTSKHYVYKNHTVVAVGYMQYNYTQKQASGLNTSRYLRVADGWTNHADRYINVHVGNDASTDEMITLYFVYSYAQK